MTRHRRYDVRLSPEVEQALHPVRPDPETAKRARRFFDAMDRLSDQGTRAGGVKKIQGSELWEMRLGDRRVFFCLVAGTRLIAVGAVVTKKTRKLRAGKLHSIENAVQAWRDALEDYE